MLYSYNNKLIKKNWVALEAYGEIRTRGFLLIGAGISRSNFYLTKEHNEMIASLTFII